MSSKRKVMGYLLLAPVVIQLGQPIKTLADDLSAPAPVPTTATATTASSEAPSSTASVVSNALSTAEPVATAPVSVAPQSNYTSVANSTTVSETAVSETSTATSTVASSEVATSTTANSEAPTSEAKPTDSTSTANSTSSANSTSTSNTATSEVAKITNSSAESESKTDETPFYANTDAVAKSDSNVQLSKADVNKTYVDENPNFTISVPNKTEKTKVGATVNGKDVTGYLTERAGTYFLSEDAFKNTGDYKNQVSIIVQDEENKTTIVKNVNYVNTGDLKFELEAKPLTGQKFKDGDIATGSRVDLSGTNNYNIGVASWLLGDTDTIIDHNLTLTQGVFPIYAQTDTGIRFNTNWFLKVRDITDGDKLPENNNSNIPNPNPLPSNPKVEPDNGNFNHGNAGNPGTLDNSNHSNLDNRFPSVPNSPANPTDNPTVKPINPTDTVAPSPIVDPTNNHSSTLVNPNNDLVPVPEKKPDIDIDGISNKANYDGKVNPTINTKGLSNVQTQVYDSEGNIVKVKGTNSDGQISLDNLPDKDGIYTLKVQAKDENGNLVEREVQYAINKNGSTYSLENKVAGGYYRSLPDNLVLKETSITKLDLTKTKFTFTLNGQVVEVDSSKIDIKEEKQADGKYIYTYTFLKDLFKKNGTWSVSVSTVDENGYASSSNGSVSANFVIDDVDPTVNILGISNDKTYKEASHEFSVVVTDNIGVDEAVVSINGEDYKFDSDELKSGTKKLSLDNSTDTYEVKVTVKDRTGNKTVRTVKGVKVTTNAASDFANSKKYQAVRYGLYGAGAVAILALLGIWQGAVRKRHKANKELEHQARATHNTEGDTIVDTVEGDK